MNKLNLSSRKLTIIFVVGFAAVCLVAVVLLVQLNQPSKGNGNPDTGSTTSTVPKPVTAQGDYIYMMKGDVFIRDGSVSTNLTNTGGKVTSFILSPKMDRFAYAVSDTAYIEPFAQAFEADLTKSYKDSGLTQIPSTANTMSRKLGVRAYMYSFDSKESKLLIDAVAPTPEKASPVLSDQQWENEGLSLMNFNEDGTQIAYARKGLYAMNLADSSSKYILQVYKDYCLSAVGAQWYGNYFLFLHGCYESLEVSIRDVANGYQEIPKKDVTLGSHIGSSTMPINIDSAAGTLDVYSKDYQVQGGSSSKIITYKLADMSVVKEVVLDLAANESLNILEQSKGRLFAIRSTNSTNVGLGVETDLREWKDGKFVVLDTMKFGKDVYMSGMDTDGSKTIYLSTNTKYDQATKKSTNTFELYSKVVGQEAVLIDSVTLVDEYPNTQYFVIEDQE